MSGVLASCQKSDEELAEVEMELLFDKLTFTSESSEQSTTITSNYDFTISIDESWVTSDKSEGFAGENLVTFTVEENSDLDSRTATVTLTVNYGNIQYIKELELCQMQLGEAITDVSTDNIFSNGDVITVSDTEILNSINLSIYDKYPLSTDVISSQRDIYFSFDTTIDEFDFSVTMSMPDDQQGWKLCQLDDGQWCEAEDVTYDSQSATLPLSIELTSSQSGIDYYALTLAFVNEGELMQDLELVQNPYQSNALAARLSFESAIDVTPTMTLLGQDDNDIVKSFESGTSHDISILGLYNNYDNSVIIDLYINQELHYIKSFTIRPEHPYLDKYVVDAWYDEQLSNDPADIYINAGIAGGGSVPTQQDEYGLYVISIGFDQYGKIRWVYSDELSNGSYLRVYPVEYNGEQCLAPMSDATSLWGNVYINRLSGENLVTHENLYYRPHHEVVTVKDNIIAVAEYKAGSSADESIISEIDLNSGERINYIDLDNLIDSENSGVLTFPSTDDYVHINSIVYSEEDDCYIVSARQQGVIKIKRYAKDSSDIVWWARPSYNISEQWQQYLLTPTNFENTPESWNLGQHSVSILPDGNIMVFDNHNEPLEDADDTKRISRAWTFSVDEDAMSIESVNEWNSPDSDFAWYMSCVYYHSESSSIVSGWSVQRMVYESSYPDGKLLFKADIDFDEFGNTYRVYKLNMYQ